MPACAVNKKYWIQKLVLFTLIFINHLQEGSLYHLIKSSIGCGWYAVITWWTPVNLSIWLVSELTNSTPLIRLDILGYTISTKEGVKKIGHTLASFVDSGVASTHFVKSLVQVMNIDMHYGVQPYDNSIFTASSKLQCHMHAQVHAWCNTDNDSVKNYSNMFAVLEVALFTIDLNPLLVEDRWANLIPAACNCDTGFWNFGFAYNNIAYGSVKTFVNIAVLQKLLPSGTFRRSWYSNLRRHIVHAKSICWQHCL